MTVILGAWGSGRSPMVPSAGRTPRSRGQLGHLVESCREADCFRVLQPRINRRNDDARLDREQLDADERHADKRIDDAPTVQDAVDDFGQAGSVGGMLDVGHAVLLRTVTAGAVPIVAGAPWSHKPNDFADCRATRPGASGIDSRSAGSGSRRTGGIGPTSREIRAHEPWNPPCNLERAEKSGAGRNNFNAEPT